MTARTVNRRQYEERDYGSNVPMKILTAVALFGLAILLFYIVFASPQQGTGMGAIRDVLCGLGGNAAFLLPLILVWAGILCVLSARDRRQPVFVTICDSLLILCAFTAVHIFFVERIMQGLQMDGFANFIVWSYRKGIGGGFIGALLAYPLHHALGVAGAFIATLLIAIMLLTATGRTAALVRFARGRAAEGRSRRQERQFDDFEEEPVRRPRQQRVNRDPYSEIVMGGTSVPMDKPERKSARTRRTNAAELREDVRPARAANQPTRRTRDAQAMEAPRTSTRRRSDVIEDVPEATPRRRAAEAPKPAAKRRGAASQELIQNPPRKRKKLYNEDVDKAAAKKATQDELFDEFDDFDRLEAESAAFDLAEQEKAKPARAKRSSFKPDRPSVLDENGKLLDVIADEKPADVPVVKADKKNNVSIDDLKIQPEAYELPDEDEPPFDIPDAKPAKANKAEKVSAGIAEPKTFPKLKRIKEEVREDDAPPYNYPPLDLLAQGEVEDTSVHNNRDMQKAHLLEDTLQSFGISAKLTGIAHGPAVTRFELQPAPGVKVSRITSLSDDIALNLAAMSVRIEAPIPGKAAVGVEIPNDKVEMVRLRDVLESSEARKHPSRIAVGLGKDNSGRYIVADIAKMPHVLIAGQTGSGKSVCINAIITSILFRASPEEVKLILIDPKVVELSVYNNIPHLVCPVVTDPKKAASALDWAVAEMTKRYKLFAERGVRDIKGYNKSLKDGEKLMPQMVIIIDELADLMMVSPGEVEDSICRLAQLARACGMHLVIATQRPSVNVITGIIKANIPTRIAFSVASQVDSRTMIDHGGAEKLLGNGDMLFVPNGMKSMRVQGAWVSDDEVHNIVEFIKQDGEAEYDPDMLEHMENATRSDAEKEEFEAEYDPKLPEAVDIALDLGQVSISMLQRKMRIGYARAGRIIDEMSRRGIVSEADGSKPRNILITREQANEMFEDCA